MNFAALKDRRVLLTGHTGFKGSWLSLWLNQLGALVHGYSLPPPTTPSNYELAGVASLLHSETIADIRDRALIKQVVAEFQPEVILHLAAQPLVRESYLTPFETFEINTLGTASVLEAVRGVSRPCAVICITTDKCYENREQVWGYRECDPMGGHDPYSASKGAAELLVASWRRSFFAPEWFTRHGVQLATARAGNVVGGGDWAKDRIITDLLDAAARGVSAPIRSPQAVRPWQHVLEPLSGYLKLAAVMLESPAPKWSTAWNFGPMPGTELTVGELATLFMETWGGGLWEDQSSSQQPHEAVMLRLCIDKVIKELAWCPQWECPEMIRRTAAWYKRVLRGDGDARAACLTDIVDYMSSGSR